MGINDGYSKNFIIIITFQTANPNWESRCQKPEGPTREDSTVRQEETQKTKPQKVR